MNELQLRCHCCGATAPHEITWTASSTSATVTAKCLACDAIGSFSGPTSLTRVVRSVEPFDSDSMGVMDAVIEALKSAKVGE